MSPGDNGGTDRLLHLSEGLGRLEGNLSRVIDGLAKAHSRIDSQERESKAALEVQERDIRSLEKMQAKLTVYATIGSSGGAALILMIANYLFGTIAP
mgnify:CR=1 FL=1|jgi:hypothetical protein